MSEVVINYESRLNQDPRWAMSEGDDGISYVNLPTLIELKLASGMSGADRMKDLADVQELIKILALSRDDAVKLNSYVSAEFRTLWESVHGTATRFLKEWHLSEGVSQIHSWDNLINSVDQDLELLNDMRESGVAIDTAR